MSDRKETPDLLGDILSNQQDNLESRMEKPQQDVATVGQASDRFGVSQRTIRTWASEFAGHLSPGANPAKGEVRGFNEDDMAVLANIARFRTQNMSYKEIHKALEDASVPALVEEGSELQFDELVQGTFGQRQGMDPELAQQYEEQIAQLEAERDQLRERVKNLSDRLAVLVGQFTEAQTAQIQVEEIEVETEKPDARQRTEEESASTLDSALTLEDRLKQISARDHWWQVWKR
jgi:DNA-binding transcriptional MerR regulator